MHHLGNVVDGLKGPSSVVYMGVGGCVYVCACMYVCVCVCVCVYMCVVNTS